MGVGLSDPRSDVVSLKDIAHENLLAEVQTRDSTVVIVRS